MDEKGFLLLGTFKVPVDNSNRKQDRATILARDPRHATYHLDQMPNTYNQNTCACISNGIKVMG